MKLRTLLLLGAGAYAWKRYSANRNAGQRRSEDRRLDQALDDTFPASDPPSMTTPTSTTAGIRQDQLRRDTPAH